MTLRFLVPFLKCQKTFSTMLTDTLWYRDSWVRIEFFRKWKIMLSCRQQYMSRKCIDMWLNLIWIVLKFQCRKDDIWTEEGSIGSLAAVFPLTMYSKERSSLCKRSDLCPGLESVLSLEYFWIALGSPNKAHSNEVQYPETISHVICYFGTQTLVVNIININLYCSCFHHFHIFSMFQGLQMGVNQKTVQDTSFIFPRQHFPSHFKFPILQEL